MRLLAVLGFLLAAIQPAAAYDSAEALVEAIYAPYLDAGVVRGDEAEMRSEELNKMYASEAERVQSGEGAAMDFDPFVNGQDYEITDFSVALTEESNEYAATANVSFKNFGEPVELQLMLFNYEGGWRLEDLVSTMPGKEYILRDLLSPKIVFGDETFADPKAVVEALYSPYAGPYEQFEWRRWDETQLFSAGLKDLFEKDRIEANGELGRIDFDPWINGQDFDVTALVFSDAEISDDRAIVPVQFKNFDHEQNVWVTLVNEDGRWKVDDLENFDAEHSYRLRAILEAPLP